jgi:hypothetical protein
VTYPKIGKSKLSATSNFGKKTKHVISGINIIIKSEILDTWHSIQVHYLERDKNQQVLGSYHNFHLAHKILVKHVALQRRHIRVLQAKILDSERPKFQRYVGTKINQ